MDNNANNSNFHGLIFSVVCGCATEQQQAQLVKALEENPELRGEYVNFLMTYTLLHRRSGSAIFVEEEQSPALDIELWKNLAEYEKNAPVVEVPKEKPQPEPIAKNLVLATQKKQKVSRFNLVLLILNAAAMLFLVLFIKFAPPRSGSEVATLTDSINAEWGEVEGGMEMGTRLSTNSGTLFLRDGLAQITFDNETKVIVEGPAEFELGGEKKIDLKYGHVYAAVPHEATGFTIKTPTSRIIDLGTEFGVHADTYGDVYLHVIKGKTTLLAGDKAGDVGVEVTQGQAKKVSGTTLAVSDIRCQGDLFVQDINSERLKEAKKVIKIKMKDILIGEATVDANSLICSQGPINQKCWGYFSKDGDPISLNVGDELIVTIEFTPRGSIYNNSVDGFRFGLFNDPTDKQVLKFSNSDSGGSGEPWMDSTGYGVQFALSGGPNASEPSVGKRTDMTNISLMGAESAWIFAKGGNDVINRLDTRYRLTLRLNRVGENKMEVAFTISDAERVISSFKIVDDPSGSGEFGTGDIATKFDQLFLRFSSADSTADILEFHEFKIEYLPKI